MKLGTRVVLLDMDDDGKLVESSTFGKIVGYAHALSTDESQMIPLFLVELEKGSYLQTRMFINKIPVHADNLRKV